MNLKHFNISPPWLYVIADRQTSSHRHFFVVTRAFSLHGPCGDAWKKTWQVCDLWLVIVIQDIKGPLLVCIKFLLKAILLISCVYHRLLNFRNSFCSNSNNPFSLYFFILYISPSQNEEISKLKVFIRIWNWGGIREIAALEHLDREKQLELVSSIRLRSPRYKTILKRQRRQSQNFWIQLTCERIFVSPANLPPVVPETLHQPTNSLLPGRYGGGPALGWRDSSVTIVASTIQI